MVHGPWLFQIWHQHYSYETIMVQHRHRAIVGSTLLFALLGIAACSDSGTGPTPPPPPGPITLSGLPTSGATLHQLALTFTVVPDASAIPGSFAITIDGAPLTEPYGNDYFDTFIVGSAPLSNGTHTAHVTVTPTSGRGLDTTFTFTTEVDTKAYQSTVLPPLAGDADAIANDMNAAGVIVGASGAAGHSRAVTWTNAVPAALPTTGALA